MQQMEEDIISMYASMGISRDVYQYTKKHEEALKAQFEKADRVMEHNQLKVVKGMQDAKVSAECFNYVSGYGYADYGRDKLEEVYAKVFHTEDALVRPQIVCGTHALALALSANLRPGDEMISISGKPYDTLEEVIGIRKSRGSLAEYGVTYKEVPLLDGTFDHAAIRAAITDKTRLIAIQRSKGYLTRPTLSVKEIGDAIALVKSIRSDLIVMVDNCYGEFVELTEPSDVGADMIVGSLIKNPGGGLAPIGGYVAGTHECIENCAVRLSSPGLGKEVGASLGVMKDFYQGFFLAPSIVNGALKGSILTASIYEALGYNVIPDAKADRHDKIGRAHV